ncbi:MAG: hypothetical protein IPK08_15865 [Bacteroidetes bacterium]|nr:hypothetical protein [Bacteroidota bacterium]
MNLTIPEQFQIFRGLAKFMVELDFRTDTKQGIIDYFMDFAKPIIINSITRYPLSERPSLDDLTDTLSNHVFLDRKDNGSIGFINDFVFGTMIAQGLVLDEYDLYKVSNETIITNFKLAVQSYKINTLENGLKLYNSLLSKNITTDQCFISI